MAWSREFDDPTTLPDGVQLVTLLDAGNYITGLSKAEQKLDEWRTAVEALIMAAEDRGPLLHARIGIMRALNHGKPDPAPMQRRKRAKAYRVIR